MAEFGGSGPLHVVVHGSGDLVVPLNVGHAVLTVILAGAGHRSVKEPEGDVDALHLFDVVVGAEQLGQIEVPLAVVLVQRGHRGFLLNFEGEHKFRLQRPGQLPGHNAGVAAIRAGGGGGGFFGDQLRAAGGALIGPEVLIHLPAGIFQIGGGLLRFLFCLFGSIRRGLVLFCVQGLNLRDLIGAAAEVAGKLAAFPVKPQRRSTGRTLVVGYFRCHVIPP